VFSFEKDPHRYGQLGISEQEMTNQNDEDCDDDDDDSIVFDNSDKEIDVMVERVDDPPEEDLLL
jgi:hypothetical protein